MCATPLLGQNYDFGRLNNEFAIINRMQCRAIGEIHAMSAVVAELELARSLSHAEEPGNLDYPGKIKSQEDTDLSSRWL
jgi:hypothetical protein